MNDFLTDAQMVGGKPPPDDDYLTDEQMVGGTPLPSSGGAGAFARGAAEGAIPTVGGLGVGLGAGALATAATGNPLIGLGAGLVTGLGAGEVISRGQDWLMEKMGLREGEGNFSRAQQQADEAAHPYLKAAGAAAPSALLLKPTGAMIQRGVGAAIGGGISAADELIRDGEIDPGKVAIGAATGFALPTANRAGAAIEAAGSRAGARAAPYLPDSLKRPPQAPETAAERPPMSDDVKMTEGDTSPEARQAAMDEWDARQNSGSSQWSQRRLGGPPPLDGEVLPPDLPTDPSGGKGGATFDLDRSQYSDTTDTSGLGVDARTQEWQRNVDTAAYQLDKAFPEAKPFWQQALTHAQTQLDMWRNHGQGKADPSSPADASQGPQSDVHQFTPADADRANDTTLTNIGSAQEQPRAARVVTAGNPVGYGGANREAAGTASPLRNYPKANATPESFGTIDIDRPGSPIAQDIQAALGALETRRGPPKPPPPVASEPPRAPEAAQQPTPPEKPAPRLNYESAGATRAEAVRSPMPEARRRHLAEIARIDEKIYNKEQLTPEEEVKYDTHHQDAKDRERNLTNPSRQREPEVTGAVTPRPTLTLKGRPNGAPREMKMNRGERAVVPEKVVPADIPTDKYARVDAPREKPAAVFSPKEEANLLQKIADMPRENENARTGVEKYRNVEKVGDKEVQLGRGEVGKRRKAALTAFTEAAQDMIKHGVPKFNLDPSKENLANVLDHATKLFEASKSRFGGKDPTERGVGYAPKEKPKEFNLVEAARKFVNNPTPANMKPYVEALALEGKIGKKEYTGKDSHKVEFTDAVEADLKPSENREEIEPRKPTGDQSFDHAQRELEAWVGHLTNDQWAALDAHHDGDLAMTVKTTRNPELVLKQFRNDLSNLRVRPGRSIDADVEHVAEDATPETKKAVSEEDELAQLISEQETGGPAEEKPAERKYRGIKPALHDFLFEDVGQEGWLDFAAIGRDLKAMAARLMSSTTPAPRAAPTIPVTPSAPAAAVPTAAHVQAAVVYTHKATMEYGRETIQPWFTRMGMRISQYKFDRRNEVEVAVADKANLPSRAEFGEGFKAREDQRPMAPKMQAYWDKWLQPRFDALKQLNKDYIDMARDLRIPGYKDLKDIKTNGPGFADYMPHVRDKEVSPQREMDVVSQTLSPWAAHAQTREMFSLQNLATGDRLLYKIDETDPGHITILRNGAPQRVAVGKTDMAEIGTDIGFTVKGVKGTWRVDLGKAQEIRDNAGRNPDGTPKVDFIDNPHMALLAAETTMKMSMERMRMLASLLTDKRFTDFTTKDKAVAEANGWVEHKALPQLKDTYMAPAYDWHLQDFVKRGINFDGDVGKAKAALDNFAQTTAKIFFSVGGPVHGFNVLDKWFVGRGKDWFTPQGWKGLGKFGEAMRSVSNQDPTQRELAEHGMNMLYVHTKVSDMLPEAGRKLGMDMTKNAWKWDPFAKKFGITTQQLSRNLYREISSAPLWWFTDVLATQRYLELKGQGLSPKDAVKKLQHSADDYVMHATMPMAGESAGSRLAQKVLSDPSISWFAAFHQHTLGMLQRMATGLVSPKSTMSERVDAATQMALLGAMTYMVYPAASSGYAYLTDNKHAEFERRGVSRVTGLAGDIVQGKKGPEDILRNVYTPSSVFDTGTRLFQNKTFSGKPIVSKADYRDPRNIPRAAGQLAEFGAQQFVSPYKTISTAAERPGATPGSVAKRFAESAFNLKTPTPQQVMMEQKNKMKLVQEARQRQKHPTGLIEGAANWATR